MGSSLGAGLFERRREIRYGWFGRTSESGRPYDFAGNFSWRISENQRRFVAGAYRAWNLRRQVGQIQSARPRSDGGRPVRMAQADYQASCRDQHGLVQRSIPGHFVRAAARRNHSDGYEQNYTRFGEYLAGAISEPKADLDKDGQTSLLEAFLTASHRVDEFYLAAGRLVTEYALLDDNGDGFGTRADWFSGVRPVQKAEDGAALDGYRAHQFHLVQSETENKMPPELRIKRDRLELEVIKLRDSKDKFSEEEYFSRLENMLLDIAQIYEQADQTEDSIE